MSRCDEFFVTTRGPLNPRVFQALEVGPYRRRLHLPAWNTFRAQWNAGLDALALAQPPGHLSGPIFCR